MAGILCPNFGSSLGLCLPNAGKHIRLSITIPIGTNSQIHLFAVGVSLTGFWDSQDGIWGPHFHTGPPGAGSGRGHITRTGRKAATNADSAPGCDPAGTWWAQRRQWGAAGRSGGPAANSF